METEKEKRLSPHAKKRKDSSTSIVKSVYLERCGRGPRININ